MVSPKSLFKIKCDINNIRNSAIDKIGNLMGINKKFIDKYKTQLIENTDYKNLYDRMITNKTNDINTYIEKPKGYKVRVIKNSETPNKNKNKYNIFTTEFFEYHLRNNDNWTSDIIERFCNTHNIPMNKDYTELDMNIRSEKMKLSAMMWSIHPNNSKMKSKLGK
jgi:hypothetical protein